MSWYSYDGWRPYVSVAERRRQAAKKIGKMAKAGRKIAPVEIDGRKITATFWGDAGCRNLEAYSDYANRLPRGRTYVRNGSVIDLQIEAGRVRALVSGSDIYEVDIQIKPIAKPRWADIKHRCAGQIDSLVELLKGSISKGVMEIVTRKGEGLFPSPAEIALSCSCRTGRACASTWRPCSTGWVRAWTARPRRSSRCGALIRPRWWKRPSISHENRAPTRTNFLGRHLF